MRRSPLALLEAPAPEPAIARTPALAGAPPSVVLIGFDDPRRRALASALELHQVRLAGDYPAYPDFHDPSTLAKLDCSVVIVNLDQDPDVALDLVETISRNEAISVMAYSSDRNPATIVRCMRNGARELLMEPVSAEVLAGAFQRAAARRRDVQRRKQVQGKVVVFCGAKGGSGVTTLAANFAIALKQECGQGVALVDLKAQLGDVAVTLGLAPRFTTMDALRSADLLDHDFVATLMTEHPSGLSVLASPDQCSSDFAPRNANVSKLLSALRAQFSYVVVDGGAASEQSLDVACDLADAVYVVTQAEIPALRNARRLIEHIQRENEKKEVRVDLVLNRCDAREADLSDGRLEKVLSVPLKWKMPNDYFSVCKSVSSGTPLAFENAPISRLLRQMAREACGKPVHEAPAKRGWFN